MSLQVMFFEGATCSTAVTSKMRDVRLHLELNDFRLNFNRDTTCTIQSM